MPPHTRAHTPTPTPPPPPPSQVGPDDLEELDQAFLKSMRKIAGATAAPLVTAAGTAAAAAAAGGGVLGSMKANEDGSAQDVLTADEVDSLYMDFTTTRPPLFCFPLSN